MSETYVDGTTPLNAVHMNALQQKVEKNGANGYPALDGSADLALSNTQKIKWGADTNLYRASASLLQTDTNLTVGSTLRANSVLAQSATANQIALSTDGRIYFSNLADTNLYRAAAASLKTDGSFTAGQSIIVDSTSGGNRIYFGGALDTNLYRSAAYTLRASENLEVNQSLILGVVNNAYLTLKQNGAAIYMGASPDTSLYRAAAGRIASNSNLVARETTSEQVWVGGGVGPGGQSGVGFGAAVDAYLYRKQANSLALGVSYVSYPTANICVAGAYSASVDYGFGIVASNGSNDYVKSGFKQKSDASGYYRTVIEHDGVERFGWNAGATAGFQVQGVLYFGGSNGVQGDTNLYRSAAGLLKTDGDFHAGAAGDIVARPAGAGQVVMGARGPSGQAGFQFGSTADTNLYRAAAGVLRTDLRFDALTEIYARAGGVGQVIVGNAGPAGQAGFQFGSAGDTNLYRSAAGILRTTSYLVSDLSIVATYPGENVRMGGEGPSGQPGFRFGASNDTNLYRSAANTLQTDGTFNILVAGTSANWTRLGLNPNGVGARVVECGAIDSGGSGYRVLRITN